MFDKIKQARQKFHQTHEEHQELIVMMKELLIIGMIIMAVMYQYTGFITEHPDLFGLEILTYASCSFAAYLFICFMRNSIMDGINVASPKKFFDFWKGAVVMIVFTIIVVVSAEIAGMNTKFVHGEEHRSTPTPFPFDATTTAKPRSAYMEEALRFKEEMWEHMIIVMCVMFVFVLTVIYLIRNDPMSFRLLVAGAIIAVLSLSLTMVKKWHALLIEQGWLPEDTKVKVGHIALAACFAVIFVIITLVLLTGSLLRYDSFKIYSYFADRNVCGATRSVATIIVFILEAIIVSFLFAVPILYVGSNRNKPELGKDYKLIKDKEVWMDLGLLTFKIFIFLVALQATGLFDSYNKGFCRKDGCNVRLAPGQQQCVPT